MKLKKGDEVKIIAGGDKGRKGAVLEVQALKRKVRVKGVKIQTRHHKKEGLVKKEGFIDWSNVKLLKQAPANNKGKAST